MSLTKSQRMILETLKAYDGALSHFKLGHYTGSRAWVTTPVEKLRERGLVTTGYMIKADGRRVYGVQITEKGMEAI